MTDAVQENDLKGFFYVFGELKSVVIARKSNCAFVNFATRAGAELAFEKAGGGVNLGGAALRVSWAKSRPVGAKSEQKAGPTPAAVMDALQAGPPPPPGSNAKIAYPSQDPTYQGSTSKYR